MRPVIGVTCYLEPAAWGDWHRPAALVPGGYLDHVRAAGGRAVLLPPDDRDAGVLDRLDGLLLSGGADVDPARYGAVPRPGTVSRPDRDAGELVLVHEALRRDLPLLGICRGMQLLTVACGGRLHQHLPDLVGHLGHQPAPGQHGQRRISTVPGSRIERILGPTPTVHCYHHQAVADPGRLWVTARADDAVIEAVEDRDRRFVLGVQWHPEEGTDPAVIAALVRAAGAVAAGSGPARTEGR